MQRKKRRLKKKYRLLFSLILLVFAMFFIRTVSKGNIVISGVQQKPNDVSIFKPSSNKSYLNDVDYNDYDIPKEVNDLIVSYMDNYYRTMKDLKVYDDKDLFSNNEAYYIDYSALRNLVNSRTNQLNDLTMSNCKYDITYEDYEDGNIIDVTVYEDGYYNFKFMKEITSKSFDVENNFEIEKVDGKYKIKSIDKVQDFYVMITDQYSHTSNYKDSLDKLVNKYNNIYEEQKDENLDLYSDYEQGNDEPIKSCDYEIDRDEAYDYATTYGHNRNDEWHDYGEDGGNCQNYASQVVYAGGIPMDIKGDYQWKNYGTELNTSNVKKGRSNSWTSVSFFYEYASNNNTYGLCSIVDANIYYAEVGDVIQVGYEGYTHAVVPIKTYEAEYDEIIINSNTNDLENYPLSAYAYPNIRLIKILGYNE